MGRYYRINLREIYYSDGRQTKLTQDCIQWWASGLADINPGFY
jgi:hypothetical protein